MCKLCEDVDGLGAFCPDCCCAICFDVKSGDDVVRPACVTSAGDLRCDVCVRKYDEAEERELDAECSQALFDELQE